MRRRAIALSLVVGLLFAGCAVTKLHPIETVHNAEATHIWLIKTTGQTQHVMFCDAKRLEADSRNEYVKQAHTGASLCVEYTSVRRPLP